MHKVAQIFHIYAIGDISWFCLGHKASYEGKVAAEAISGMKTTVDYRSMPAVCYRYFDRNDWLDPSRSQRKGFEAKGAIPIC